MFRTVLVTIFLFVLFISGGVVYFNYPKVKLSIENLTGRDDYFPKDKVNIRVTLSNNALKSNYFTVNMKSQIKYFTPAVVYLQSNRSKDMDYTIEIPAETTPGSYNLEVSVSMPKKTSFLYKNLAHQNILLKVKELPPAPVVKKIEPISGKIKFIYLPDQFIYNKEYTLKASFSNTTDREGSFILSLNISGPDNALWTSSHTLILPPGKQEETDFQFNTEKSFIDGEYLFNLKLSDAKNGKVLSSDSQIISLVDNPPNIELNAMFNKKENKVELICKVNDDVSVKNVELNLNDLAKNYSTNYALSLMSGNLQNGIWSCSIGLNKKTNKADFYIMAQDSKNQESKTEIYKITSFIEK